MRKATKKEQIEVIQNAVEAAIQQAAELSGLRNWLIWHHLKNLKEGEWPNGEMICVGEGESLEMAFDGIIDPDDREFLESPMYLNRATEKGIFKFADLLYDMESKHL